MASTRGERTPLQTFYELSQRPFSLLCRAWIGTPCFLGYLQLPLHLDTSNLDHRSPFSTTKHAFSQGSSASGLNINLFFIAVKAIHYFFVKYSIVFFRFLPTFVSRTRMGNSCKVLKKAHHSLQIHNDSLSAGTLVSNCNPLIAFFLRHAVRGFSGCSDCAC